MKVMHLSGGGDIGGAKSHILSLVSELQKHIQVCLVSLRDGEFAEDAKKMGIDVRIIRTRFILADLIILVRMIRREKIDIVHAHGSKANMMMVLAKCFASFISVTTVHSDYRSDYLHSLLKKYTYGVINRIALVFIKNYVAVSANFKTMLTERGFKPSTLHVVYNGIDFDKTYSTLPKDQFLKKYNINITPDAPLVGIAARLHPVKGVDVFINAAAEALKVNSKIHFVVCGDGDQRANLENMVKHLNISDNVHFLGHISNPWEALQNFSVNVLSSHSESFPYSILEGAFYSLPTISSDVGGISDLIEHGTTGFLFPPGDYKKLSDLILRLIEDPETARKIGTGIYKKASENFSLKSMCNTQISIYEKLINKKNIRAKYKYEYDIVLSGYYGYKNSGDDAILLAITQNLLQKRPDLNILVLSASPIETSLAYNVDTVNRFNLISIIRAFRKSMLFIYGGGNLLQDDTSTRSLYYYLFVTKVAIMCKLKVMYYSTGIGPINKKFNKKLTARTIKKVNLITLRENMSKQELKMLGIDRPEDIITADPVFTLTPVKPEKLQLLAEELKLDNNQNYIGISLREWKNLDSHVTATAHFAEYAYNKYGLISVFIPMQYPEDLKIIQKTVVNITTPYIVVDNKYNIPELLGIISMMSAVVAMRLHALIYSANAGIPMIGLSYENKINAFMELIGLSEYITPPMEALNSEMLSLMFDSLMEDKDTIAANLKSCIPHLKEKAYESADLAIALLSEIKESGEKSCSLKEIK